jgi:hypothetical protein
LKIPLAGQFQKSLVGGCPKPQDHPRDGDGCAFVSNTFWTLFTDGDKMRRRYFSIPQECVAATNVAFRGAWGKPQQAIWDFEREAKNSKLAFVYTNALLATTAHRLWS